MYWDNIIKELSEYGNVEIWKDTFMAMSEHDNIAGVKLRDNADISIISHKFSYGGTQHLFEIMPGTEGDVDGYLKENEVIEKIHLLLRN